MALSRFLQLHNSYYHGTSSSSFPKTAANLALSSLIPHFSPSLPSFSRSCTASGVPAAQLASDHHHHQHLTSPELVALEYADLNLSYKIWVMSESGNTSIHLVPLSLYPHKHRTGTKSLATQHCHSRWTLDVLVKRAEVWAKDLSLNNIHFLFANATISFKQLVTSYPGPLMFVSILCPDPHFKKRHHKRRVLQKPLVDAIIDTLMPDGQVLIQSDVLEVALDMRNQFDEVEALKHMDAVNPTLLCDSEGWLLSNPMGIRTEREIHAELEGSRIYRRMYLKQI